MFMKTIAGATAAIALTAGAAFACPDWEAAPTFGAVELEAGFTPDPLEQKVEAGGDVDMQACAGAQDDTVAVFDGFVGFVAAAPDFDIYWTGNGSALTIAVSAQEDLILLINAPDGTWHYMDDTIGTNPVITFNPPIEGLYDIWIGTLEQVGRVSAQMIITEDSF